MPPPKLTADQKADLCVAALKSAKATAKLNNRNMSWDEVRAVILPIIGIRTLNVADNPFGNPRTIPPLPEWVEAYSRSIGYPVNGQAWCDSYAVKDWKINRNTMKNWQAAVRNWKTNKYGEGGIALASANPPIAKDYTKL